MNQGVCIFYVNIILYNGEREKEKRESERG